jgi:phage/plasmid-like protein (TIGR03299 family)
MAHMLEMINGQAQMAYRASKGAPWHRLGVPVSDDMTPEQMMKAAGLDWTVRKVDTFIEFNGERINTGTQALIRETDGKILTEVGSGWNPVQNSEAFEFFADFVAKGDMIMDTAGSLNDGRRVWALADVRDGFTLFGGDEVKGYLLFSNPHLYGNSIDIKFVLTRVVCNNTIAVALNEKGQPSVRVNHRAKFNAERVKEVLGLSHRKVEKFKEAAEFLGSKRANVVDIQDYLGKIFGESSKEDQKLSRTAETVMEAIETQPGADFQKGTWWPVLNSVTYACDHVLGRSDDTRLASAWFGGNAKRKIEALDLALEMVKAA